MSIGPNIIDGEFVSSRLGAKVAQRIGDALSEIARKAGDLTPELVVKAARSKRSPLHGQFTWDDSEAAKAYRLVQAAWLIRTVKVRVIVDEKPAEARAFIRVVKSAEPSRDCADEAPHVASSYVGISEALENPDWRGQMLNQALRELEAFRRKYEMLEELADVMNVISERLARR
jgi:hypothetical protein